MGIIPFDDRDGYIWLNGEMIPWRDAKVHSLTHSLHYGGCVFEGERAYSGQIFELTKHSERLRKSAELVDFEVPMSVQEIDDVSKEIIEANNMTEGYIRPFAWRGAERMGLYGAECNINVGFACWPWPKYLQSKDGEDRGIALVTSRWRRMDPRSAPVQSKASGFYMLSTMAKQEAARAGYDDVLMLDCEGYVAESSASNLFAVKGNVIKTPIPDTFLNGITRQTVMRLAKELGYKVEETRILPEEMADFDEVFLTGTAVEIASVGRIDDIEYSVGPAGKKLQQAYADLVHSKAS